MTIFLWCLGILAYTALVLGAGAFWAFVYYGRGKWTLFVDRVIPARPPEYLDMQLKALVNDGVLTSKQADIFSSRLWADEVKRARVEQWGAQQDAARAEDAQRASDKQLRDFKKTLNIE